MGFSVFVLAGEENIYSLVRRTSSYREEYVRNQNLVASPLPLLATGRDLWKTRTTNLLDGYYQLPRQLRLVLLTLVLNPTTGGLFFCWHANFLTIYVRAHCSTAQYSIEKGKDSSW